MAKRGWLTIFLVLLVGLGLPSACGSGNENGGLDGDVEVGEDLHPDSERLVLVEMFTSST